MDTDGPENRTKAASKTRNWDILDFLRRLPATFLSARIEWCFHARSCLSSQGGLVDPRLRASNEALSILTSLSRGVAKAALDCAHRTSTVLSCAFCEQGGHLAAPSLFLYFLLLFPYFTLRPLPQPDYIILVLEPDQRADDQRKD
jgi:hypothetical protein